MKKSNIAFSGFMAAILISAGAANAATTQIASKTYVDNKETSILQTVGDTYETKANVQIIQQNVNKLGDTINNEESGLKAQIEDAAAAAQTAQQTAESAQQTATGAQSAATALGVTVGNAESGLVKDVNDLEATVGGLQTTVSGLDKELDSKLDSATAATTYEKVSNKSQDLATDAGSTDKYPSAKAVVDWVSNTVTEGIEINTDKIQNGAITTEKIGDDAVTADKIAPDAVGNEQIADGAVSSDKLDETLAGQIADISGKQDKNMGVGHENHIVTTDETGNITSAATIGQAQVTGLTDALAAKADASALETIEQNVEQVQNQYTTINETVTELGDTITNEESGLSTQITNITQQIGNAESGLVKDVADAAAAAETAQQTATGAQNAVDALETVVDGKANASTTLAGYGITDAYTKTETDGLLDAKADATELTKKEDVSNKAVSITAENQSSGTAYPSVGAIVEWTNQKISDLSDTGLPVNPGNINDNTIAGSKLENGAVSTDKIADNAVTEDKLSDEVVAEIDGKLPAPNADCMAESNLCVLSVTSDGDLAWVAVTQPAE